MDDREASWLAYLFSAPTSDDWVNSVHEALDGWQMDTCRRILVFAKDKSADNPDLLKWIAYCEGRYFLQMAQWERAETAYRHALSATSEHSEEEVYDIAADLGLIYRLSGELSLAIDNHQLCLSIAVNNEWQNAVGEIHVQLGLDYEAIGDLQAAQSHLGEAEQIFTQTGDALQLALTRKSRALILIAEKRLDEAYDLLCLTLPIFKARNEQLHAAHTYGNLGNIAVRKMDLDDALEKYTAAMERFQALGARLEIAGILNNLGAIAYKQKNYVEAANYLNSSIRLSREIGYPFTERDALENLIRVLADLGQFEEAFEAYQRLLSISRELNPDEDEES